MASLFERPFEPREDYENSPFVRFVSWLESSEADPSVEQELRDATPGRQRNFWMNMMYAWEGGEFITAEQRMKKAEVVGFHEAALPDSE